VLAAVPIEGGILCEREEFEEIFLVYSMLASGDELCRNLGGATNVISVPNMGSCAFTDSNVLVMMALRAVAWVLGI
jgi:hypothetical protein